MTGVAIDLLRQVTKAGGTVQLVGDALRLLAAEPLPDDLRARLRQHKADIIALLSAAEPASHMSSEGPAVCNVAGLPQEISEGVQAILSADRAQGIPPQLGRGCKAMLRDWSKEAGRWKHSHSAGRPPTCSAATSARPGTGSTGPASSC